jgi:uncharacterized protein (TIGR04255 family)
MLMHGIGTQELDKVVGQRNRRPTKILDAIIEALLEIRFEMTGIPEVLFGRMADSPQWKGFQKRNMPAYNIPAQMRTLDPGLRYQPILEMVDSAESPTCALRIGPQVLSFHNLNRYMGWQQFQLELEKAVASLFKSADGISVQRLGLRYLNALRSDVHRISSIADMNIRTTVAGAQLQSSLNVNFLKRPSDKSIAAVKIATKDLVAGFNIPESTTVFVDVDVYTPEGYATRDQAEINRWIADAHEQEKDEFFNLLTPETTKFLEDSAT